MTPLQELNTQGFCRIDRAAEVSAWVKAVLPEAKRIAQDPEHIKAWLRHGDTWFAGVNVLENDAQGRIGPSPSLRGVLSDFVEGELGLPFALDAGQLSIVYPGYPKQDGEESEAAFGFRKNRDAAHVDGLLPIGPEKRRYIKEPHGFVLGLPLTSCDDQASPMVIWLGSHLIMQAAFRAALSPYDPEEWQDVDLTQTYQSARRLCFETCERKVVPAQPGEAYFVHRLALHGVAPWGEGARAPEEGRMIAYFRPHLENFADWLE